MLDDILGAGASVNLYMAHGGTNFGLWNGCNVANGQLQPTTTSYDYDAAVGEAGELTPKWHAFRDVIARYAAEPPRPAPAIPPRLAAQKAVPVRDWVALRDTLHVFDPAVTAPMPRSMEDLGQDHGLIHYRGEVLVPAGEHHLVLDGLADRATVLADGDVPGTVNRNDDTHQLSLPVRADGARTSLEVIVENQGRINFASAIGERKGVSGIRINHRFIHGWDSTAIRLDRPGLTADLAFGQRTDTGGPVFARATVDIAAPADGFIALPGWSKGFLWLNGVLLGRYWDTGPQVTLYAPAPLWQAGANEIVILELHEAGAHVQLRDQPDLGDRAAVIEEP